MSILVIVAATLVGIGKLLMPYSQYYQPELEAWLSGELGQKVTLESFTGDWNAFGPRLVLRGLTLQAVGEAPAEVVIGKIALDVKPLTALFTGEALYQFLVIGADFQLVRDRQGVLELSGLGISGLGSAGSNAALRNLVGIGALTLQDSHLQYRDEKNGASLNFMHISARMHLDDDSVAIDLQARLQDGVDSFAYGDIAVTGLLRLAQRTGLEQARWQLSVRDLALATLLRQLPTMAPLPLQQGQISAELWGNWAAGQPLLVRGSTQLRHVVLEKEQQRIAADRAGSLLAWTFAGWDDWRLDLHDLLVDDGQHSWQMPNLVVGRNTGYQADMWIGADLLPLEFPLRTARTLLAMYGTDWPDTLPAGADGSLIDFDLVLDSSWRIRHITGSARHLSTAAFGRWPAIRGLDADFQFGPDFGTIRLQADRLGIDWPGMFPQPLEFSVPPCSAEVSRVEYWQIAVQGCSLGNETLAFTGDLVIVANGARPAVDINLQLPRGNIGQFGNYWPQRLFREPVIAWLRRSLHAGELLEGRIMIRGDLDHWPFAAGEGRLEALARVQGVELTYLPTWPKLQDMTATVHFIGPSMDIADGQIGNTGGVAVHDVTAHIADFRAPLLRVEYQAEADLGDFLGFVVQSPLQKSVGADLSDFQLNGPAATSGLISVPLGKVAATRQVAGSLSLQNNGFRHDASGISLESISGALQYSGDRLFGTALKGVYRNKPVTLSIAAAGSGAVRFRADMQGLFTASEMLPVAPASDPSRSGRMTGEAEWDVSIIVPEKINLQAAEVNLLVKSDLVGVTVDYPPPLQKKAWEEWPLQAQYPLQGHQRVLDIDLPGRVRIRIDLTRPEPSAAGIHASRHPSDPAGSVSQAPSGAAAEDSSASSWAVNRLLVQFDGGPTKWPAAGAARIGGRTAKLDLDGWLDLLRGEQQGPGLAGLKLEPLDLIAGQLFFLDRKFDDVSMQIRTGLNDITARFAAAEINGQFVFTSGDGNGSLSAEFERLVLAKPQVSEAEKPTDPGKLPELHLYVRSFRYGDLEMGETRVEAFPRSGGFHFEKVEAESAALSLHASGDWSSQNGSTRSQFNIMITAESLGNLLQSMDISSAMEGGQTVLHFDAWWPGSPAAFALPGLNGAVDFSVSRGQISNASSGSGRVLGLLSIQALPRRLAMDFSDVFDSGFGFDQASGTFRMDKGTATTDDVVMSSSSARIQVSGSTNLVTRQYDQVITIQPGLGNTLPVIGAIAGGPGGAAAGLALQGLLQKQLGQASQFQYTITGSWDEPQIEPVVR